jgi:Tfp pilus assembly protein PilF
MLARLGTLQEMDRLEALQAMLALDPKNMLALYGVAMEYKNRGDFEQAAKSFEEVILANPAYAAAYFHGGQTYEQLGQVDQARSTYVKGIEVTSRTGDSHTRAELQGALDMLPI